MKAPVIGQEDMERLNGVGPNQDVVEMNPFRNNIWAALRMEYLTRPDINILQGGIISESIHPTVYYQRIKKK